MKNNNTIKEISELKMLKKGIVATFTATDALIKSAKDKSRQALAEAILCGQKLNRAKDILGHGLFEKWCKAEVPQISKTTRWRYAKLAKVSAVELSSATGLRSAYVALGIVTEDEPSLSNTQASPEAQQSPGKEPLGGASFFL